MLQEIIEQIKDDSIESINLIGKKIYSERVTEIAEALKKIPLLLVLI